MMRILSGKVRCEVRDRIIYIGNLTSSQMCEAERIYIQTCIDAQLLGVMTEDELLYFLIDKDLWSINEQNELDSLPSLIETLKLQIWNSYQSFQSKKVEKIRQQIYKYNARLSELHNKRYKYNAYTASGVALLTKLEYWVAHSAFENGQLFQNVTDNIKLFDALVNQFIGNQIPEREIRQIAKSSMWRLIWFSGKIEHNIFGVSAIQMTEEQKSLLNWSRTYDNVYESLECPIDDVIQDDDLLDGWMITQSQKHETEKKERSGDKFAQRSKPGMQEIFIPAETFEDAQRINQMNDPQARLVKRQRNEIITKQGLVTEQNMPDAQVFMRQQAMEEYRKQIKPEGG